jgi:histidyl-tRNA synthetase
MKIQAPRGTQDVLPADSGRWQALEALLRDTARRFGYDEIRFPVFEHTELFTRGIGGSTDVVQKEMYTFEDKAGRSLTLRPEGTASVVRALVEHSLDKQGLPVRVYYIAPNFRYEKPQAGRLREHHQFGVELFGPEGAEADAEVIALAQSYLTRLGLRGVTLHVNSIGCKVCRPDYNAALKAHFQHHSDVLCDTCKDRLTRNPLRILDCKSPVCQQAVASAPVPAHHLCPDCRAHHAALKAELDALSIPYADAPRLVRGLDYYTRTVFEFVSDALGAQATVCGGGRYADLVEDLGGSALPGLGFGSGLERLLLALDAQGLSPGEPPGIDLALCHMGDAAGRRARQLAQELRALGLSVGVDLMGRGLKAQMKQADRQHARYTMVLGDNELNAGAAALKRMDTGETAEITLDAETIRKRVNL